MIEFFRELNQHRDLLYMITWRDIRIKYKQSVMGIMWAVLMPMLITSAGVLVKYGLSLFSHKPLDVSDIATVSVKAIPWAFFAASLRFSTYSLISNVSLVTKIYFPRAIFPIAAVLSQLFDFCIASVLLIIILGIARIGLSAYLLWVPILVGLLGLFTTGVSVLLSAANLFYRDVKYLVEVFLTFAIFVTPVFYDASLFGKWSNLLLLNPVAPILEALNSCVVLHKAPDIEWISYAGGVSLFVFAFSFAIFRKVEPLFAERI